MVINIFFLIELISLIILKEKKLKLKLNNECDYRDVKDWNLKMWNGCCSCEIYYYVVHIFDKLIN